MPGTNENRTPTPAASVSSLRRGHVRSVALAAAVVGVVVLPIAAAEANPSHATKQASATGTPAAAVPATASAMLPQYCGTELFGFQNKVSAQACVDDQGGSVTGTVYVSNGTGSQLTVVINLVSSTAGGPQAQMSCTVAAGDTGGVCTTDALADTAGTGTFDAIAEAAEVGAPLADGVVHVESGQVSPTDSTAAPAPSTSAAPSVSPAA
ncbi:hypothetical protein KDL01_00230 [Actinospica durhamensis]|uniref:Uncharacterized protein n=1 Tax=Actinospica durhamensis TaxID=1508375 RepID=A0A941EJS6_9ACTN|nr:hypothetical protein [Actinospica durhamensis]MBR7831663.1 hypothetical protein [Actinospica durhamensis]